MDSSSTSLNSVLHLWARSRRLSPSQRILLETASTCEPEALAARLKVTPGELATLEKLFRRQSGHGVYDALAQIRGIVERRSEPPKPMQPTRPRRTGGDRDRR